MSRGSRVIFHIDMNCFYAAVEMIHHPSLKGKPVAIAGNPEERRGIIVTSSYEAREYGVKTTMPLWEAKKLCPHLIVKKPNFQRYREASKKVFSLLAKTTEKIEPVSIDEGYLDVTNNDKHPLQLAEFLQQQLLKELDLPCSIGIGPNKFLAKTASDMKKPLGITVLRKRDLPQKLWPLPVNEMYGVGEKTYEKLKSIHIKTIADLARADSYQLKYLLGINGERLQNWAKGIDPREVDPNAIHDLKSIGSSETLPYDTTDEVTIRHLLSELTDHVVSRMKARQVAGLSVQIMIRFHDRRTITRSKKLSTYVEDKAEIFSIAHELFQQHWNNDPIRLLGVSVQDLEEKQHIAQQLDLFSFEKEIKEEKIQSAVQSLTEKYGENIFKKFEENTEDANVRTSFQKDFLSDFLK